MNNLISVIVPVYNVEKYLERCIDSILNQTYKNLEIILVDDGSTDKSPKICDKYLDRDRRVRVIHKENGGLSDARNTGIQIATGDFISFIDSDDYIDINMYDSMMKILQDNDGDIIECGVKHVYNNKIIESNNIENKSFTSEEAIEELILERSLHQTVWNKIYKKNVIEGLLFEKDKINEDEFWTYKAFSKSNKILSINNKFYYYIHREDSIMGKGYTVRNLDGLEARYNRYKYISIKYPRLSLLAKKAVYFYGIFLYQMFLSNSVSKSGLEAIEEYMRNINFNSDEKSAFNVKERIWLAISKQSIYVTCKIRNFMRIGI